MKIVGQRQTQKVLDDGDVHDVITISVLVDGEGPFSLDVPVEDYHPDTVQPLIDDVAWRSRELRHRVWQSQQDG